MSKKAVFLDRDGTIIKDKHYLSDPDGVELFDGVPDDLRQLQDNFLLVVVTNQSGVGRGYMDEEDVTAVNDRMVEILRDRGIELTDIYYAPYHHEADDPRYRENKHMRKPRPGMLEQASEDHDIDLNRSFMIGDKPSDVRAGRRSGCRSILVKTGNGQESLNELSDGEVDFIADDLTQAVNWILRERSD